MASAGREMMDGIAIVRRSVGDGPASKDGPQLAEATTKDSSIEGRYQGQGTQ